MDQLTPWAHKEGRLFELLAEGHPRDRLYVYWMQNGERISPAIVISGTPFEDLYEFLQQNTARRIIA